MRLSRPFACVFFALLGSFNAQAQDVDQLPTAWPRAAGTSDCAAVVGRFRSENAEVVRYGDAELPPPLLRTARVLFLYPIVKPAPAQPLPTRLSQEEMFFEISQMPGILELLIVTADRSRALKYVFVESEGHFTCKDGYIAFATEVMDAGGIFSRKERRITKLSDGSLAFHVKSQGRRTEMLILSQSSADDTWYRFRPVAQ